MPKRGLSNEPAAVSPIDSLFPQSSYDNLTGMKQRFKTLISKYRCFLGVLFSFSCLSLVHADRLRPESKRVSQSLGVDHWSIVIR